MIFEPRYYQKEALEALQDYTANNHGKNPIIVLPTGCISWDSIINENRNKLGRKKRIETMYKGFNGLNKNQKHNYDKTYKTFVRSFNGEKIKLNEVESVSYSGIKDLLKLKLENGLELKATPDHKIMTKTGWVRMYKLTTEHEVMCDTLKPEKKENHSYVKHNDLMICNLWFHPYAKKTKTKKEKRGYTLRVEIHRAIYECYINNITLDEYKRILRTNDEKIKEMIFIDPSIYDIHHKDFNHKNNNPENLIKLTKREHQVLHSEHSKHNFNQGVPKYSKVLSVKYFGKDHTYDIGCFENHNFVANGIVVHNSGKALLQAMIVKWIMEWDHTKILLLTHQKELIVQNSEEFVKLMDTPFLDYGIYSAGLKKRERGHRILFAGIQSVYKRAWSDIGFRDIILVDESHLIPHGNDGMYRTFISEMKKINPKIIIVGLSATPYRLKGGLLTEGKNKLFDDICYEVTIPELINPNHPKNKDKKQYLGSIITPKKAMKSRVDLSGVHIKAGEYVEKEMQDAFCKDDLVSRSVREILEYVQDRRKILVFTAGIEHCERVAETFKEFDQSVGYVHSQRTDIENQKVLEDFKTGKIKFLVNVSILTTGYNVKDIDCIVLMRATQSPGLYVQMVGRGTRLHPSKEDCLILDLAHCIETHGPIDKIEIKKQKDGTAKAEGMPEKVCPSCESMLALAVMVCPDCGYEFPVKDKHDDTASEADIISKWKRPEPYDVEYIHYSIHQKIGSPDMLRVQYYISDLYSYSEYICPMHTGFAKKKALRWLELRLPVEDLDKPLCSIQDIIDHKDKIKQPKQIIVDLNGKYPNIIGHIFEEKKEHVAV